MCPQVHQDRCKKNAELEALGDVPVALATTYHTVYGISISLMCSVGVCFHPLLGLSHLRRPICGPCEHLKVTESC